MRSTGETHRSSPGRIAEAARYRSGPIAHYRDSERPCRPLSDTGARSPVLSPAGALRHPSGVVSRPARDCLRGVPSGSHGDGRPSGSRIAAQKTSAGVSDAHATNPGASLRSQQPQRDVAEDIGGHLEAWASDARPDQNGRHLSPMSLSSREPEVRLDGPITDSCLGRPDPWRSFDRLILVVSEVPMRAPAAAGTPADNQSLPGR